MALSNWDTLAISEKGKATNGMFNVRRNKVGARIYKNWLYIGDENGWEDGCGYIEPTVAEVRSGNFIYKGLHVFAKRGPKNGIYVICWDFDSEAEKFDYDNIMIGIGCYGFIGEKWVGVEKNDVHFLNEHFQEWINEEYCEEYVSRSLIEDTDLLRFNQGDAYFACNIESANPGISAMDSITSKPGEADKPILIQALDSRK